MEILQTFTTFFLTGGVFMYPILAAFTVGIAIALERYIKLAKTRRVNERVWHSIEPLLATGDFDAVRNKVNDDDTEISSVLRIGLEYQGAVQRREDIELAMEAGMMEIVPQLEKRTPYIALFSNICTLLGLLGTIMGLIEAFTAVANANPSEKADLLSASISVAMNTTAFGLMTGITLLITHAILTSRTSEIIDSFEMVSVKTLIMISKFSLRNNYA